MHCRGLGKFRVLGKTVLVFSFLLAFGAPAHAELTASTYSVNFGNQIVGTQSASPQLVEFTNTSTQFWFTVTNVSSSLSQFVYFISGPLSVPPGETLDVWIWFTPSSAQTYSGSLMLTALRGNSIQVSLNGNGVSPHQPLTPAPQGTLSLSSSSVNFGAVSVGGSGSQVVTIANSGAANVTISNVTISGAGMGIFGLSSGQVLAPGQNASLYVSLAPAASGNTSGTVTISSDASDPQVTVSLSGSGAGSPAVNHSVTLTWSPSASDGISGYNVYRSLVSGGPYSPLTSSADPSTSYSDASVLSGQTYYYVVTALNSGGVESAYSSEVAASVP